MDGRGAATLDLDGCAAEPLADSNDDHGRLVAALATAADALGAMETAFALTLDYIKARKQFGVTIGSHQVVAHRAVDMFIRLEECRAVVARARPGAGTRSRSESLRGTRGQGLRRPAGPAAGAGGGATARRYRHHRGIRAPATACGAPWWTSSCTAAPAQHLRRFARQPPDKVTRMNFDDYQCIRFSRQGRVLTVALNRPEQRNAVNAHLHAELSRVFYRRQRDPDSDVVVLTGNGRRVLRGRRHRVDAVLGRPARRVRDRPRARPSTSSTRSSTWRSR